jgi:hypothetical protein
MTRPISRNPKKAPSRRPAGPTPMMAQFLRIKEAYPD